MKSMSRENARWSTFGIRTLHPFVSPSFQPDNDKASSREMLPCPS